MRRYKSFMITTLMLAGICLTACGNTADTRVETGSTEIVSDNETSDDLKSQTSEDNTEDVAKDDVTTENADEDKAYDVAANSESADGVTMYATESVTLHEEASGSGNDLGVVPIGSELKTYETSGDYIKVEFDGKDGYILKEYVTEDKSVADKAVEASKETAKKESSGKKSSDKEKQKKKDKECLDNGLLN